MTAPEVNPYSPPLAPVADLERPDVEYAGFWVRVGAALIDTVLIVLVTYPVLIALYGWAYLDPAPPTAASGPVSFLLTWVAPPIASILFWLGKQATPGKMVFSARVVDARTGMTISKGQAIGRYLGYYVAMLPLGLGLIWVGFDARKQGWHDKLAGTVVIRSRQPRTLPVKFDNS